MLLDERLIAQIKVCLLLSVVLYVNSLRNRNHLTRSAVLEPGKSPWHQLLHHGDDSSFLDLTGFNRRSFYILVDALGPPPPKIGRPSGLTFTDQVGLYLFHVSSRLQLKHLCMIFGIVPSSASSYLNSMMKRVIAKLSKHRYSKIKFPSVAKMRELAALVHLREPEVDNIIGFVDGLSVPVQCSDDQDTQNAYYNRYYHDTHCNNVFAFGSDGKVYFACINAPGSWHDSQVGRPLFREVIKNIGAFALCVDSGFPRSGLLTGKFLGPMPVARRRSLAPALRDIALRKHAIYISLRQAAEWGMRSLQGSFSRLKCKLTSDKYKRHDLILSIVLLHNFRTHCNGQNQIATVFDPHYEQYMNVDKYDRIARYFS